jgi:hypothetical protein
MSYPKWVRADRVFFRAEWDGRQKCFGGKPEHLWDGRAAFADATV